MGEKCGYKTPTPADSLEQQIIDPMFPKNEREWWASEEITRLRAEVEALRGITPELPPRPPEGEGLPRYGLRHNGQSTPMSVPLIDGYWTPHHLAIAEVEALRADAERYRWLRKYAGRGAAGSIFDHFSGTAIDECIDAARAAQGERG